MTESINKSKTANGKFSEKNCYCCYGKLLKVNEDDGRCHYCQVMNH